jgi:hypothetical protein
MGADALKPATAHAESDSFRARLPNHLLVAGAAACFAEALFRQKHSDPGAAATAVWGIILVIRAVAAAEVPLSVAVSGCLVAVFTVCADRGIVDGNRPVWIAAFLIGAACFGWERIRRLWS